MLQKIAKKYTKKRDQRKSLSYNIKFHVATIPTFGGALGAFLRFTSDPTIGLGMATVIAVVMISLALTGIMCLVVHKAI